MYYYIEINDINNQNIKNIFRHLPDDGIQSFPDIESNNGPERMAYLQWLSEGNQPLPWPPE